MASEEKIYTSCKNYETTSCPHRGDDAFRIAKDFPGNFPIKDNITVESVEKAKELCAECQNFKKNRPY